MSIPGFELPRTTQDEYIQWQWVQYGLGTNPSMADIEPVFMNLFEEGKKIEAAEIVLGRRVDSNESFVSKVLVSKTPEEAFGLLLLEVSFVESKNKK